MNFKNEEENKFLVSEAQKAQAKAHCVYSNFPVGAALLTAEGTVVHGCNIESASYSPSCCAERSAIFSAISQGMKKFSKIAVVANTEDSVSPCGVCRQVLSEFCAPEMEVILANKNGEYKVWTVKQLLPYAFALGE